MEKDNFNFSALTVFQFLWKWRKVFIIIFIVSGILSYGLSYLIKPKYKSTIVMMPAYSNSVGRTAVYSENTVKDLLDYGEEEECEYLVQTLTSSDLFLSVAEKFNLTVHYDIDPNSSDKNDRLYETYCDRVVVKRTDNLGVKVTVTDTDPKFAAEMAKFIGQQVDDIRNKAKKDRAGKTLEVSKIAREQLVNEIQMAEDSMRIVNEKGVLACEEMMERYSQQMAIAVAQGNQAAVNRLQEKIDGFTPYIARYMSLRDFLKFKNERLSDLDNRILQVRADAEQNIPIKFVVEQPRVAERKDSPKRLSFTFMLTFASLLVGCIALIFIENGHSWIAKIKEEPK